MTTSPPRWRAAAIALVLALLLVVAGCSGDGDDSAEVVDTAPTTPTEESSTTAVTTEADGPDDGADAEALAEAVILTPDDFDADWVADAPEDDGIEVFDCLSDLDLDGVTEAEVDSDELSQSDTGADAVITAGSTGLVLTDEDSAAALLEEVGGDQFAGCALGQLVDGLEADGSVTVTDSDLTPNEGVYPIGDESVTLNGSFAFEADDGTSGEGDISLTLVRTGAVVTGFNVSDVGDTEFATVVDQVASIVGDKHLTEVG